MYKHKYSDHIKLRELTKNPKLFIQFISLLGTESSNKKINHWVKNNYGKWIYPSSIALAHNKITTAKTCKLSVLQLFRGKVSSYKPLHQTSAWNVLCNELARINRGILTGTETNADRRELPSLLRMYQKRAWLDENP